MGFTGFIAEAFWVQTSVISTLSKSKNVVVGVGNFYIREGIINAK